MKDEIVKKLRTTLSDSLSEECQVVYILVELRKLLERTDNKESFPILKFYCDWALHAKAGNPVLIKKIEEEIKKSESITDTPIVFEIANFKKFHKELMNFLSQLDLKNKFNENDYWNKFRALLVEILSDCPLKPNDSYEGDVEELCFEKSSGENEVEFLVKLKSIGTLHCGINFSFYERDYK